MAPKVPTLYEWLGGAEPLNHLIARFYEKVPADPLLEPLFAHMPQEHFHHVALFIAEVFGGPADYSALPQTPHNPPPPPDPESRSPLVAYLEGASRLAVINSALPADTPVQDSP